MKKIFMAFLVAAVFIGGCSRSSSSSVSTPVESVAVPDFTLNDIEGKSVSLSSFKGVSPVLIVFWATWCPYCREEMPNLVRLKESHGDKLEIMAVAIQESLETVGAYARKNKINFTMLVDEEGNVSADYGVLGVPTLVLVDKEGVGILADNALSPEIRKRIEGLVS